MVRAAVDAPHVTRLTAGYYDPGMKISALSGLVVLLPATALANPGDAAWRKQVEADVNGQGVVVSSGDAAEEGQTAQERLTKACGRGMKVLFDWSAFKPEDWVAEGGTDHLKDLPGVCM